MCITVQCETDSNVVYLNRSEYCGTEVVLRQQQSTLVLAPLGLLSLASQTSQK